MELSVVIPCLNESETLQICINKIRHQLKENNIIGEIIVADNGSTDSSIDIAKKNNVRIVNVKLKGYGNAVREGIKNATGKYVLIADADNSYDFNDLKKFYDKITLGFDIVQGCRLPSGGGKIKKNAMPITHRLIGNPFFSLLSKLLFKLKINDVYCGMKIIKKDSYDKMFFYSTGMVFCLEILIKFKQFKFNMTEIPITLHKDGRITGKSHLKTISDGLRTLKFLLIFSPKWIFFVPGVSLLLMGLSKIIFEITSNYFTIVPIKFNTPLILLFLGMQIIMLGFYSSIRAETLGFKKNKFLKKFFNFFSLKKSIFLSISGFAFSGFFLVKYLLDNDENIQLITTNLLIFVFFVNLFFNSLFVSLLKENN